MSPAHNTLNPQPARVAITSTQPTNQNSIEKSIPSTRSAKAVYANHTVKPGSDITLIINKNLLGEPNDEITINTDTLIKKVNGQYEIVVVNDPNQTLTPSNIINNSHIINGKEDIYYNFRASSSLLDYLATMNNADSLFLKISVISKKRNFELIELVRASHDPNFIRFDVSCDKDVWSCLWKDSVNYEMYQVHFYNASKEPACSLACRLKLPLHLDINSVKVMNPVINGNLITSELITTKIVGDAVHVIFPKGSCIRTCESNLPNSGHVDFYIVAKRLERGNQSLSGVTIFNKGSDIEKEYELLFRGEKYQLNQEYDTIKPNCENLPDGFPMCLIIMGATAAAAAAASPFLRKLMKDRSSLKDFRKQSEDS